MRISDWSSDVCPSDLYGRRVAKEYLRTCFKPLPAFCRAEIIFPAIVLCAMLRGGRIDAHATDRVNDLSGGGPGMGSVRLAAMIMFHEIGRASCRESVCQYV